MIISHRSKYVFCHIPKTGGTSIEEQFNIRDAIVISNEVRNPVLCLYIKHITLRQMRYLWGSDVYNNYYRFSVVRNPFERVISSYWHLRRSYENYVNKTQPGTWRRHLDDMDVVCDGKILELNPYILRLAHRAVDLWTPACDYLRVDDHIDCEVYKFEDGLDNVVQTISARIRKNDPEFPMMESLLPHHYTDLRRNRQCYRDVIGSESREVIERVFRKDFEAFGYEW
jgi:hypothetical protein